VEEDPLKGSRARIARDVGVNARRVALVASQAALALPFVLVTDCNSAETTPVVGRALLKHESGWMLGIPLAIAVLLFAVSFRAPSERPAWRGFAASFRAMGASIGGVVALGTPFLLFLFDTVRPLAGWWLAALCWVGLYLQGLWGAGVALKDGRAPAAGDLWDRICRWMRWLCLVMPWPIAWLVEPDLDEALAGASVAFFVLSVPLWMMLTACSVGIRRKEPWAAGFAPVVASLVGLACAMALLGAVAQ
jgi:hypothetical protein